MTRTTKKLGRMFAMPLTICIARLRERTRFTRPLFHILDSFYVLLHHFMKQHPEYRYTFYNITFDGTVPTKNLNAVKKADVVVIPTEQEFHYHLPGYFHSFQMAKSKQSVLEFEPYIVGKKLIALRYDRADNESLYRHSTFPNVDFKWECIDEMDFPGGVAGLRFHFIREWMNGTGIRTGLLSNVPNIKKVYDFCYWGSVKNKICVNGKVEDSGDERHKILKMIYKSDLECFWIGRYLGGMKADMKMNARMSDILPHLAASRSTLCFNWLDNKATTARYHEAVAVRSIPFVWKDYDIDNTLVMDDWQRVREVDEFVDKVKSLQSVKTFNKKSDGIINGYKTVPVKKFHDLFEKHMLDRLAK